MSPRPALTRPATSPAAVPAAVPAATPAATPAASRAASPAGPWSVVASRRAAGWRGQLIGAAFGLSNSLRVTAYLPTLGAIAASGDTGQHSLLSWGVWLEANLSTAFWLRERGAGLRGAVPVAAGNAVMCAAAVVLIVALRL